MWLVRWKFTSRVSSRPKSMVFVFTTTAPSGCSTLWELTNSWNPATWWSIVKRDSRQNSATFFRHPSPSRSTVSLLCVNPLVHSSNKRNIFFFCKRVFSPQTLSCRYVFVCSYFSVCQFVFILRYRKRPFYLLCFVNKRWEKLIFYAISFRIYSVLLYN